MAINNFDTKTQSFIEIMGNGKSYVVPKFQRDYSWEEEQWEDLWQDIIELQSDDEHYMGHLLLQTDNKKDYTIIDGQQRLTTITIIILAGLHKIKQFIDSGSKSSENEAILNDLMRTYVGFTDFSTFVAKPKLTLNYNNDRHFRNYLCAMQKPPIRKVKASERLLSKAQEFFIEKINTLKVTDSRHVAKFVDGLVHSLQFTTITVASDLNAYKVFETLNARGVKLSTPDLIKNYLFSIIDEKQPLHDNEIRNLEEMWENITSELGKDSSFSRFIHVEWNSRKPLIQKGNLFKEIKKEIKNKENSFAYLHMLQKSSEIYSALEKPKDTFWERDYYKKVKTPLKTLDMFNIVQPHVVLIAAYYNFSAKEFVEIAKYIEIISVRYNVIGNLQPNVQERIYNKIACAISSKEFTSLNNIKNSLKELYPSDEDFYNSFVNKHMRTSQSVKKVRYILARIEESLNSNSPVDDELLTLEHVLPRNPEDGHWDKKFVGDALDECAELVGNMTLLQSTINIDLGTKSFSEKKEIYKNSPFTITKMLANYEDWNSEAVEHRQKWLAEQAVKCWRIDFE